MSTIKYINLCVTKDELIDYLYNLYDSKYKELLKNRQALVETHDLSKFRFALYSISAAFGMYSYLRYPTTSRFWWETFILIMTCLAYNTYKKCRYIPPVPDDSIVPSKESLGDLTYEEILDTDIILDERSPLCCARALCLHAVDMLKLLNDGRVLVLLYDGTCSFIKPVLIREGDIDAITINSSGTYFGNQCNVATSSVIKTFDVDIEFERT